MRWALGTFLLMLVTSATQAETIYLYAAGSLRAALTEVARAFEVDSGAAHKVETTFGASGLLRERIEAGAPAHVFASADTGHPKRLAEQGFAVTPARVFARNELCALAREGLSVNSETLLDVLLHPKVRLGTSTGKADPSGDYAFALFAKAEKLKAGAQAALEARALQLTGGPTSEKAPPGRNPYAWVMAGGKADLFLTYCTNAVPAQQEVASLQIVQVPEELSVGADYGLIVLKGAPPAADTLALFILGDAGQAVLGRYGFGPGDGLPR
jgi:molybdate transport system substrate-binding protein